MAHKNTTSENYVNYADREAWPAIFAKMVVDDLIVVPFGDQVEATKIRRAIIRASGTYVLKKDSSFKISLLVLHNRKEVRVWRD